MMEAHFNLGNLQQQQGKLDDAVESYQMAIDLDPSEVRPWYNLGLLHFKQGRIEKASECLQRVIVIAPDLADGHGSLGAVYVRQRRPEDAIESLQRAIELDPSSLFWHRNLAITLRKEGKREQAIASYLQLVELDPSDAESHSNLGTLYHDLRQFEDAAERHQRVIELLPDHAVSHFNLGLALRAQDKFEDAVASLRTVLTISLPRKDATSVRMAGQASHLIEECLAWSSVGSILRGDRLPTTKLELECALQSGRNGPQVVVLVEAALAGVPEVVAAISPIGGQRAARAAALLAASPDAELDAAERARVRGLARDWLSAAVESWLEVLNTGENTDGARKRLTDAREDLCFDSLRGPALKSLPEAERLPWQALWDAIDEALDTDED